MSLNVLHNIEFSTGLRVLSLSINYTPSIVIPISVYQYHQSPLKCGRCALFCFYCIFLFFIFYYFDRRSKDSRCCLYLSCTPADLCFIIDIDHPQQAKFRCNCSLLFVSLFYYRMLPRKYASKNAWRNCFT